MCDGVEQERLHHALIKFTTWYVRLMISLVAALIVMTGRYIAAARSVPHP